MKIEKKSYELRMYGLVPYNISPIQQAIQFGHAVVEYGQKVKKEDKKLYNQWADNHKTFIILNGGTTNTNENSLGTLNLHMKNLQEKGIFLAPFYEPDLGDQLTAFVFLVDERVFNRTLYPDFVINVYEVENDVENNKAIALEEKRYKQWVKEIGGEKNVFLREYLRPLKLA